MKTSIIVLVVAILFCGCYAEKICKEFCSPISVPNGWIKRGEADPNSIISLTIAVKQSNSDLLQAKFWAVSDPLNEQYGQFLSLEQMRQLVTPSEEMVDRILVWLNQYQILDINIPYMGDYIQITMPLGSAEEMLSTEFFEYVHLASGKRFTRSPGPYYIPAHLNNDIDFIGGVVRLPKISPLRKPTPFTRKTFQDVDPAYIKQAFNIPASITGKSSNNSQAVAQFDVYQQYFSASDLTQFQQENNLPAQQPTVVGGNDASNPGDEAMLDIEYIMGIAPLVPTWFVTTNGTADGGQEPFLAWIVAEKNNPKSPWVHSVSYGDTENTVSLDYADRVNNEFMIFGAMGRSILFASGDDGANCNNNGNGFLPNFPASSPYVTAVGGITNSFDTPAPEQSSNFTADSISSGGFSNYFDMPAYQKQAVAAYLKSQGSNLPPSSYFNVTGRAFPDVCSFSEGVVIVLDGSDQYVGGTSCAAPVVSGVVSLLNDARLQKNKSTLGFLNPLIYSVAAAHPDAFIDITTGSSQGCGNYGWNAAVGWDAVTGVGAPNFANLLKYALQF